MSQEAAASISHSELLPRDQLSAHISFFSLVKSGNSLRIHTVQHTPPNTFSLDLRVRKSRHEQNTLQNNKSCIKRKEISDLELWRKQEKIQGLKLISPWTVRPNYFQQALTFRRLIRESVVMSHKGPPLCQGKPTCFLHTMSWNFAKN